MCNGNLKNFSNAGGWSMAFYGFAASLATPSTWSLSAVSVAVSARAVGRGGWPKVPPCWLMKYCLNNHASVGVELPVSAAFPVWGRLREGAESYAKALASDILR